MNPFYTAVYSLVWGGALVVSPFVPKIRRGFYQRFGLVRRVKSRNLKSPFWFHFASSGEFEQCLPILEEIKKRSPEQDILLTYFSPSAERAMGLEVSRRQKAGVAVPWDFADYGPFDFPWHVGAFLKQVAPKSFIAINREIWPNLLLKAKQQGVSRFLFAAFLPERNEGRFSYYRRWTALFDSIRTVDDHSAQFLKTSLIPLAPEIKIQKTGDPRVERVLRRKEMQRKSPPWKDFFAFPEVKVVSASVWPKDFEALKPSLLLPGARHLVVPHEPDENFIKAILVWGKENGLKMRRWSHWLQEPDDTSHLVVDQVGQLAELYAIADFVFVGGSFVGRIHNVLEPAAYGKPILTGPFIWNSAQAIEWNALNKGLKSAKDSEELLGYFKQLLEDKSVRAHWSALLTEWMSSQRGIAERYADALVTH